jgi:L-amino acid N-acyltransferase YncA
MERIPDIRKSPQSTVSRLREIHHWEGTGGILNRLLAVIGYRQLGWYIHNLQDGAQPVEARTAFEFAELSAEDVGRYVVFRRGAREADILARMAAGNQCFAALCNGEIASVSWIAVNEGYMQLIDYRFPLEADEIYVFDSFTARNYRGKRIQSALYYRLSEHFRDSGYRAAITMIVPENRPNIVSRTLQGFRLTGSVTQFRFGPFSWHRFRGERRPDLPVPNPT